jgi:hypothetical protein
MELRPEGDKGFWEAAVPVRSPEESLARRPDGYAADLKLNAAVKSAPTRALQGQHRRRRGDDRQPEARGTPAFFIMAAS